MSRRPLTLLALAITSLVLAACSEASTAPTSSTSRLSPTTRSARSTGDTTASCIVVANGSSLTC